MPTLRIEHPIHDFDTWKAAFERDPAGRRQAGVRRYAIHRPIDNPHYVLIDLDFDSAEQAAALLETMQQVWKSNAAAPALAGEPRAQIVDTVESKQFAD